MAALLRELACGALLVPVMATGATIDKPEAIHAALRLALLLGQLLIHMTGKDPFEDAASNVTTTTQRPAAESAMQASELEGTLKALHLAITDETIRDGALQKQLLHPVLPGLKSLAKSGKLTADERQGLIELMTHLGDVLARVHPSRNLREIERSAAAIKQIAEETSGRVLN